MKAAEKEFNAILETSKKFKADFISNIRKEKLTYDELIEAAAEQAVTAYVTSCVMFNIHDLSKSSNNDKMPKNFVDYIRIAVMTGMRVQTHNQAAKGAQGKSAKYQPLQELAEQLVNARKFPSRRNAAKTIMPEILSKAKELKIPLSEHQAETTITGWLKERGLPANI